jgi:hypothetical protein
MSQEELVDAYRKGEIDSWTCVRRLLKLGVSVAAALSMLLTPGVARADDGSDDCQAGVIAVECLDDDDGGDDDGDDDDDDDDDGGVGGGGDGDNLIPPNLNLPPNINVP